MTDEQMGGLLPTLREYLGTYAGCFQTEASQGHLGTYVRGLLSDLPRKTVEPIALRAGTPVRTLQEFLKDYVWDFAAVRDRVHNHLRDFLPCLPPDDLGLVGLIDETSAAKKGNKTPGVQRQYLGCLGKKDNGIVTVHLGVCQGPFKTLIDADLFLPESWADDRQRCRQAGIPDELEHRTKGEIALGQLDRAKANGLVLDWVTFDEEYGKSPPFVRGLDKRELRFVGEVPSTFSCVAAHRSGRQPAETLAGKEARQVVRGSSVFLGQSWQVLRLSRQTLEDQVWRVKAARVWLHSGEGWSAKTYWLIWASNDETGEEKYFLSNAPQDAKVEVLVRVAFRRANVEHGFRVCKSELGFTHFEGRNYGALMRHMSLCLVAMNFVAGHTQRLWGEKPRGDDGASLPRPRRSLPDLVPSPTRYHRLRLYRPDHPLPPGAQPLRSPRQAETTRPRSRSQETQAPQATPFSTATTARQGAGVAL